MEIDYTDWAQPEDCIDYLRGNQSLERGLNRTNCIMSKATHVLMKLTCGPVTTHTDGVIKNPDGTEMINKNVTLNANYSNNKEDNNFSVWTPQAKLEFQLTNPVCDIFAPGKKYKLTIEEWPEENVEEKATA